MPCWQMHRERVKCMIFREIIAGFMGLCGGVLVSAGLFAFIVIIGAVTRLISRTNTAGYIMFYENMIIWGAILGNAVYVFNIPIPFGVIGVGVFGVFCGMFIGCLSASLAEMVKVMPAFEKKIHLQKGMAVVICAFAIGKMLGSILWLW